MSDEMQKEVVKEPEVIEIVVNAAEVVEKINRIVNLKTELDQMTSALESATAEVYAPVSKSVAAMEAEIADLIPPELRAEIEAKKMEIINRYLPEQSQLQQECDAEYERRKSLNAAQSAAKEAELSRLQAEVEEVTLAAHQTFKSTEKYQGKPYGAVYFKASYKWLTELLEGAARWEPKLRDFCEEVPPSVVWKRI